MISRKIVALGACAVLLSGCGNGGESSASHAASSKNPEVLASFYPVAEMAERLGAGAVTVKNLTPAGTEPHDFELSPENIDNVKSAALVLYVGHGFAPAIERAVAGRTGQSVDVTAGMTLKQQAESAHEHAHDHDHAAGESAHDHDHAAGETEHVQEHAHEHTTDGIDPHFWLDPTLLSAATHKVESALVQVAPDNAEVIKVNAEKYRSELAELDGEFKTGLHACKSKTLVTSHAAFGYLAARYGLEQHPMVLVPDAEPDPKKMAELADVIKAEGVTTVFSESLVSPKVADALAREANIKTAVLNPLEGLTEDQLKEKKDYRSVMRENLQALRSALSCA